MILGVSNEIGHQNWAGGAFGLGSGGLDTEGIMILAAPFLVLRFSEYYTSLILPRAFLSLIVRLDDDANSFSCIYSPAGRKHLTATQTCSLHTLAWPASSSKKKARIETDHVQSDTISADAYIREGCCLNITA